jgi:hypothetical protein
MRGKAHGNGWVSAVEHPGGSGEAYGKVDKGWDTTDFFRGPGVAADPQDAGMMAGKGSVVSSWREEPFRGATRNGRLTLSAVEEAQFSYKRSSLV